MSKMKAHPEYLRASFSGRPVKVDREAEVLQGYVVAQEGPFKSEGRGEFNEDGLRGIVRLGNAARGGLKSRFTHPDLSSDGLGKFLGRAQNFSLASTVNAQGETVKAVRADLHFDPSAHNTPNGDLSKYIMDLAESDPSALSSSIVVKPRLEYRLKKDGAPETDKDGEPLPPLWFPEELHASDIVDTGDAVDGLLSARLSPDLLRWDNMPRIAALAIDQLFEGESREVIEARCVAFLRRHLDRKFPAPEPKPTPRLDALGIRLREMSLSIDKQSKTS